VSGKKELRSEPAGELVDAIGTAKCRASRTSRC